MSGELGFLCVHDAKEEQSMFLLSFDDDIVILIDSLSCRNVLFLYF